MPVDFFKGTILVSLLFVSSVVSAQDPEIDLLRSALNELRADYDARIGDLEQRLDVAEQNLASAQQSATQAAFAPSAAAPSAGSGNTAFNPAIGVIFTGSAWGYSHDPADYRVQGFPLGGEAGPISEGVELGETELDFSANVDDKFSAWLTASIGIEDGDAVFDIEEAWVEATALPAGLGAKIGRFFSGIGYLNSKHAHAWDFADQPLPYQAFLGGQLLDDGIQLRWLAPTDTFIELGGEALRGSRYPATGAVHDGFGSYSIFANLGRDVGISSSWLAGLSFLDASAIDRPSGDADDPYLFTGDSKVTTINFVWKWAPNGNWHNRNLILQGEYLHRRENGIYSRAGFSPAAYRVDQDGWYAQAVYQPMQRWRFGGRFDTLSTDSPGAAFDGTVLAAPGSDPWRFSLMADWANSEFSRLRLQFTRDEAGPTNDNQLGLQYIYSIGAHGAHTF